ncbi:hypothetical protein MEO40_18590 [Dolichospermum sp. ST_sed1]|nr:hypothetical protein [Dolichospermum sp. ST_sed1]MDD1426158.1 hypothetical protein [Dolichospermum sp. ST_sed9]MDD1433583.1 hypothetical protein [Dolichospermum sp. ST_sed6]MDD1441924.1 hypothetical protein [Dolichospermum sp. ST_sed3]MDD1447859.1 hypothetical protein [Dolichospermum sp. ST_sed8]MDD1457124.1 hypothetical protein [Dolichospermum sp. ST_sed7]MDD1461485.1 hypothetical protein [Dolichospermum sp. ST_sed2]MDD1469324.1 hypothetical protein [Dolichospermum sp. ST_sed5]MDD147379
MATQIKRFTALKTARAASLSGLKPLSFPLTRYSYECYPLWWVDSDKAGDIDPETLELNQETVTRLEKWADIYDARLNWEDPANSRDLNPEEKAAFEAEGISLWKQLQKELAPNYEVVYFSETLRKVVTDMNESESLFPIYA